MVDQTERNLPKASQAYIRSEPLQIASALAAAACHLIKELKREANKKKIASAFTSLVLQYNTVVPPYCSFMDKERGQYQTNFIY
jgi:hypothetical protein